MTARETAPAGGEGRSDQVGAGSLLSLRRRVHARPDLWSRYPDPARYLTIPTMFGLTLEQYRAEYRRCQSAGWTPWDLAVRFPRPEQVAA